MNDALMLKQDMELGEIFIKSGLFKDTKDKDQAIVKILAGREIGLTPFESMTGLDIIQGNITIGGNVMASKVKASEKYDYKVKTSDNQTCVLDFYENGEKIGTYSFTMEDAKLAGLTGKDVWKKYPGNMLFNRAISNGVRRYCPDVFGCVKVYDPEEMGGEPINITPEVEDWTTPDDIPDNEPDEDYEISPRDRLQAIIDEGMSDGSIGDTTKIIKEYVPDFPEMQPDDDQVRNILVRLGR